MTGRRTERQNSYINTRINIAVLKRDKKLTASFLRQIITILPIQTVKCQQILHVRSNEVYKVVHRSNVKKRFQRTPTDDPRTVPPQTAEDAKMATPLTLVASSVVSTGARFDALVIPRSGKRPFKSPRRPVWQM